MGYAGLFEGPRGAIQDVLSLHASGRTTGGDMDSDEMGFTACPL